MNILSKTIILCFAFCDAIAAPIEIVNPSGEINNGTSPLALSNPAVIGWNGAGVAQVIAGGTHFGNGKWRFTIEDSAEAWQMTPHVIAQGNAFSLRFDAAMFAGNLPGGGGGEFTPVATLVGGATRNGNFNAAAGNSFADLEEWVNVGSGNQSTQATNTDITFDGSRNAVLADNGLRRFAVDPDHTLAAGEAFRVSFVWRDAGNWDDTSDRVGVALYTTADDTIGGARTVIQTLLAPLSTVDATYEAATLMFGAVGADVAGKKLFVFFEGVDGNGNTNGFARLDNFVLERGTISAGVPERQIIAELYVVENEDRVAVASRTYDFKTPVIGAWDHYHLAVPAGMLDSHVGKTVGVRFRSNDLGDANFQSFDNVRLDVWAADAPNGAFADDWNNIPNQRWVGPSYWANRLQDWRVNDNRVNCINGTRDRLAVHRTGTSMRGNGGNFSFSVRTGLHLNSLSAGSRSGFLIGAGPNLDWKAAMLVQTSLRRDFGLFAGISGGGNLVIEDYTTSPLTSLASVAATGGFAQNTRLVLSGTYNAGPGTYTLTLTAFNASDVQIGTVSTSVPSDRVLGSFGLISHRGTSSATHWFDDFSGSGTALEPEPERHLAIIGAMHTLSQGKMKMTAQLPPLSLAGNPTVALDTWNGASWTEIATAPVDNTDGLSSYTATFAIAGWNDMVDVPYRLRVSVGGNEYAWTGTVRRDPVEKEELVIALTSCQRINDFNIGNPDFDWTPVRMWHPHSQSYLHMTKHQPDLHLAVGDQIYEPQPTPLDTSSDVNRQLDFLYKWYLWMLQARELARDIPTVVIPDDHDVFQGNIWGAGGIATTVEVQGGYTEPAEWVKMVERCHALHLPDPDPYNPVQPAPPVEQGIRVYFTGMTYGRIGFAILEDRKFKSGPQQGLPVNEQQLLGERQHEFLREWNKDWAGQDMKLVVSQTPFGALATHQGPGYNLGLNDRDTNGWPTHRRNEALRLLRVSRMFHLAGDQHLATIAHHGADVPRDSGISFAGPAMSNFFPRIFDPMNSGPGTTPVVSPYIGDYFFDGNGTLPDGVTPNLTSQFPHHFAILGAGNSPEYYQTSLGINPENYHDRGAGYGIVRVDRQTREFTFEAWPIHADPEYPETGGQFSDWPQRFRQTDNDGRLPTGFLTVIDTLWRQNPVIRVYDEASNELVHAMRIRGSRYRPPVYDNEKTYRVEIAYGDEAVSEVLVGQTASVGESPTIHFFGAVQPSIIQGEKALLEWNVSAPATLIINQGIGDVMFQTVDGIGYLEVVPTTDTTYTLTLNGDLTAETTIRVFPGRAAWNAIYFTAEELSDPSISGGIADPDGDGFTNDQEYQFQTNPRDSSLRPRLEGRVSVDGPRLMVEFEVAYPLSPSLSKVIVEVSSDLKNWHELPANGYVEIWRENFPTDGTSRVSLRLTETMHATADKRFFRANWNL